MPTIRAEETWLMEAKKAAAEIVGELDAKMELLLEVAMSLALQGHREGLVELV